MIVFRWHSEISTLIKLSISSVETPKVNPQFASVGNHLGCLGDEIRVMVNDDRSTTTKELCKVNITGVIHDALAADFDGDSKLDLFVLYKIKADQLGYNGGILWGDRVKLSE